MKPFEEIPATKRDGGELMGAVAEALARWEGEGGALLRESAGRRTGLTGPRMANRNEAS